MITVFRVLILFAIASLLLACMVPFQYPLSVTLQLDRPPPAWLFLGMVQMCSIAAMLISSVGLLMFKRWAVYVGVIAAFGLSTALIPATDSKLIEAMGMPGGALFGTFAVSLIASLALTRSATIASRFSQ